MQELTLIQRMAVYEPTDWNLIPDLGLYMDQVITYIEQQLKPLYGEAANGMLTPSMINNYVKSGLLQRPLGKKYYREHLALLMMIVTLKQVASMDVISRLIALQEGQTVHHLYEEFCQTQLRVVQTITVDPDASALQHAVTATAYRLMAEAALTQDRGSAESPDGPKELPDSSL